LKQKGNKRRRNLQKKSFHKSTMTTYPYSMRRKVNDTHQQEYGITRLKPRMNLNQKHSNLTSYLSPKLKSKRNSLNKICKRDISNPQNHQWHHLSFLLQRKMKNYNHAKIINISTTIQSRMHIQSPTYNLYLTNFEDRNTSLHLMFDLDTTISVSENKTNGKLPSEHNKDFTNQL